MHARDLHPSGSLANAVHLTTLLVVALMLGTGAEARAQTGVLFSPDITARLGTVRSSTPADHDISYDDAAGRVYTLPGFPAPVEADLNALHYDPVPSLFLASFDVTAALPGLAAGSPAEPRDVVSWDPATGLFAMVFDGSTAGVPAGAQVDGVSLDAAGDLVLSFDVTTALPGVGAVDDEDVVTFSAGSFSMLFDGSANGVGPSLDVDGVHRVVGTNVLLLSFDVSGSLGALAFDDEDVIAFDLVAGTFAMYADASLSDPLSWRQADLVAVPEPGVLPALTGGIVWLACLARVRARRCSVG